MAQGMPNFSSSSESDDDEDGDSDQNRNEDSFVTVPSGVGRSRRSLSR